MRALRPVLIVVGLLAGVLGGFNEEMMFRGFLQRLIETRLGSWWALGTISVIFGLLRVINFAHGAQYMLGAFVAYVCVTKLQLPFLAAVLATFAVTLVAGWLICVAYVMRYAKMVRSDPSKSLVADKWEENRAHFLGNKSDQMLEFTTTRKIVLGIFNLPL